MKKKFLIFFVFISISCFAQFSKTHYIPPLSGANSVLAQEQYLYISTPSTTPVNVKIDALGVGITTVTVSKNSPIDFYIGNGTSTQLHVNPSLLNIPLSNKGYIIEAENLIYVAARVLAGNHNQAGSLVSKGITALGNEFRVGAFVNTGVLGNSTARYTFLSILATENNTLVNFSDIKPGVTLLGNNAAGNTPQPVTLNRGQSYVLATEDMSNANKDGLIGALVKSNKPIVFNCGSFGGTNGNNVGNLDLGFDQIVPAKSIGNEYIFVRGFGLDITERPLLVIHENNTDIYLNGSTTPYNTAPLNAGSYTILDGSKYSASGSLYVRTSKNVFAYQSVGGTDANGVPSQANQEMFFVPPLNCATPSIVDNIPFIQDIGPNNQFIKNSGLNIVTEVGATVEISINGVKQPIGVSPKNVVGNSGFVTYTRTGLTGNIGVFSSKQVYVSYFGSSGAATYGGYYSGFDTKPEIVSDKITVANSECIPNVILKINSLSSYDTFEWYKNGALINGETQNSFKPTDPGYYQVKGSISGCPSTVPIFSDKIPVSYCSADMDNDGTNNNVDIDNDNDGITNCTESYGNSVLNILIPLVGSISTGSYNNAFTGALTTSGPSAAVVNPFIGNTDGSFVSETPTGKDNTVSYEMNFTKPISIALEYVTNANAADLINSEAEFIVKSPINKTITVLNPDNQLLIDTNYDGIFESGVKEYSSFEIRFRLNSTTPLAAGTGTFSFRSYLTESLTFIQKNLSETSNTKATFLIKATCVPKESDLDGSTDDLDSDSDNDGIPDTIEAQGNVSVPISNMDTNKNGLDNAFEPGFTSVDTDGDGIPDYLDLDSDNDGILDSAETANDFDGDGIKNYRDLDSDNDLCSDVIEAGFLDANGDKLLGSIVPPSVDGNGKVTSGVGYNSPNANYLLAAPIGITVQPKATPTCELQNTAITLTDNVGNTYQWQISTDGTTWSNLTNIAPYSGANTNTLTLTSVKNEMNRYKYRVQLNRTGNSCGLLSDETTLTVFPKPIITSPIVLKQCDDDNDGKTTFNLTQKNSFISSDVTNTFTFFENNTDANDGAGPSKITNPTAYINTTAFNQTIYVRVETTNGCATIGNIELKISTTTIPPSFNKPFTVCDDLTSVANSDYDGVSVFDFHSVTNDIKNTFLTGTIPYSITYYRNENDALSEINPLNQTFPADPNDASSIYNYRNIGYPNFQKIWVRVDSTIDNACFGLGPYITLTVEKLPFANPVLIPRKCDDNQDGIYVFDTSTLETTLLGTNQSFPVKVTYFDALNNPLKDSNGVVITSPFPRAFSTKSQIIKAVVTNNTTLKCYDETTIQFIVDDLPEAFPIPAPLISVCDDELDPMTQDGKFAFDTSSFESTILGGQIGMTVKYFDQGGASLSSPLPNPFTTGTQNIKVIVENPINTNCSATLNIPFIVNPLPLINLNADNSENNLVCSNLPTFSVILDAGVQTSTPTTNYTYIWSKDGTIIPNKTAYTLAANTEGNYTVQVSTNSGCSRIRKIKVTASDLATISSVDVVDFTDINAVTVNVTGKGNYEYSLNDPSGPFQTSNIFNNIPAGIYDVFVNDINGCGMVSKTISVIGVPKYFTPNNDGFNDYWKVKGIDANFNAKSVIYIFDRYGKLIKQILATGDGWDGTFNGNLLPSDDYWYAITLEDGRQAKGHFSLKR